MEETYVPLYSEICKKVNNAKDKPRKIEVLRKYRSEGLEMFLKSSGITFEHLKFNDHHFFTDAEIEDLKKKETILTTEKDYVRLKSKIPNLHYIEVKHEFLYDGKEALRQELLQFMTKNS